MPQIDTPLLLDILLGLIILLFVPFGIRRGVAKEAMVSAGLLLGVTLAESFGETWGQELSGRFSLESATASFASSALLLLGSTFILGYGGGAALGATRPGVLSRLSGGLLAAFNGALLLSHLLSWIELHLRPTAPLDDGIVSEALLRQTDRLLLYAAGVLLALTVIGWVVNAMRSRRQPHENGAGMLLSTPARQRPPRAAPSGESGKYEPGRDSGSPSGRFGSGLDATAPLSPGSAYGQAGSWPEAEFSSGPTNGHARSEYGDSSGHHAAGSPGAEADQTVWTPWSTTGSEAHSGRPESSSQWPVAPSVGVTGDERCAVCRARVGPRDVFCPECGATL